MADIFTLLDFSTSLDVVFWAVCLVVFLTFFRKLNLLAPSPACFDRERHFSRHHISFSEGGAVIQVNWSKIIQFRERVLRIPLPVIHNCVLCPSRALWLSLKLSDTSDEAVSPSELIQAQGDWRSDVYLSYLDPSLGFRKRVAHTLGQALCFLTHNRAKCSLNFKFNYFYLVLYTINHLGFGTL